MWLLISKIDQTVMAVAFDEPQSSAYNPEMTVVKEWDGPVPQVAQPDLGIPADRDPTLDDPRYTDRILERTQARIDAGALLSQLAAELDWLDETIPAIESMTLAELRAVLKRLAQENRKQLAAWRYVLTQISHAGGGCNNCGD